jgi:uncharacterized membrane protein|tara:strand:+ start:176 stop:661 length:486 start_codon:yes stop_codon:yes gene_type:complete
MASFKTALVLFVSAQHVLFCALETCMWRGAARGIFGTKKKDLNATAGLAANQGVYNLFLAMGAALSLYLNNLEGHLMFTTAMFLAACFGCTSASSIMIFFAQGIPSLFVTMVTVNELENVNEKMTWRLSVVVLGVVMSGWGYFWKKLDTASRKKLKAEEAH